MNRNFIACSLGALLLAVCFLAEAQQPKKVTRIGYLGAGDRARESTRAEAIRLALRELGYIEGQNIASEYRYAEGKQDRLPELAAELVRLKVDAIFTAGTPALFALKQATKTIPIVFFSTSDPIGTGVVASLAHPGGNITGMSGLASDLWP